MATLTRAHEELFRSNPDTQFETLDALMTDCRQSHERSQDQWVPHEQIVVTSDMSVVLDGQPDYRFNDWSFSQLCRMAGVSRDTINRLSHKTASRALQETLPTSEKPFQILTSGSDIRSIHGVAYTQYRSIALCAESSPNGCSTRDPTTVDSDWFCGESWAWMQDTPFRKYKHFNHKGGIATPLIAHWPAGIAARCEFRQQPAHLIDVMATVADLTQAEYPAERNGQPIYPLEGTSLRPAFEKTQSVPPNALRRPPTVAHGRPRPPDGP